MYLIEYWCDIELNKCRGWGGSTQVGTLAGGKTCSGQALVFLFSPFLAPPPQTFKVIQI